jgi:hypothetical protein
MKTVITKEMAIINRNPFLVLSQFINQKGFGERHHRPLSLFHEIDSTVWSKAE